MTLPEQPVPVVRAVHRHALPVEDSGEIRAGYLHPDTYRPYPPGATVVLDAGNGWWMSTDTAVTIARALAHVAHLTVTGTGPDDRNGIDDLFGTVYGLDAIADAIRAAAVREPSSGG